MIAQPSRQNQERYRQLRRILTTAEVLRQFRFGCSLDFLNREVNERQEERWHPRSTLRDLTFLESCGMVDRDKQAGRDRWRWCADRPLAEARPERIDRKGGAA